MPGTSPRTVRSLLVIRQPASSLSKLTTAVTSSRFGGVPFFASPFENAIEKQAACAAATSSSGLVWPAGPPVRDAQLTGRRVIEPEVTYVICPEPDTRSPLHVAWACRDTAMRIL